MEFDTVSESMKEHDDYYSQNHVGDMVPKDGSFGAADIALNEVMKWLGFHSYPKYAFALSKEREKIFLRAKD